MSAGWGRNRSGRVLHWYLSASAPSVCGKGDPVPAVEYADDDPDKGRLCVSCDRWVQSQVRDRAPEETPLDLARRALGEHAVIDRARELARETDARLAEVIGQGGRLTVEDLGMVYTTDPKGTYKVSDRRAFVEWVKVNRPGSIVSAVDYLFEKAVLVEGCTSDGEVPDGIEFVVGASVLTVRPSGKARELVADMFLPPALPGAGEGA